MKKYVFIVLFLLSTLLAATTHADLIAHWTMDANDSDPNYLDVSGNGNDTIVSGTPVFVDDVLGNPESAVSVNALGGYGNAGTDLEPKSSGGNQQMTLSVWTKFSDGLGGIVLAKRNNWGDMMWQFHVDSNNVGLLRNYAFGWIPRTNAGVAFDQWHLITLTHDEFNVLKIYVDGQLKHTQDFGLNGDNNQGFVIGCSDIQAGVGNEIYNGMLDDVRVYDTVLTAAEVAAIYREVITAPTVDAGPASTLVKEGTTAELTCSFASVGNDRQIIWFKQVGDKDAAPGNADDIAISEGGDIDISDIIDLGDDVYQSVLSIANGDINDEALYYCVVSDSSGTDISDSALITLKRLLSHWTLNLSDYETYGGAKDPNYLDMTVNGNNATVSGTPVFVDDIIGNADSAVAIDPDNGWASDGTLNPSKGGQMTVSAWINFDGQPSLNPISGALDRASTIMSKRETWENMMWQLNITTARIRFESGFLNGSEVSLANAGFALNQWHLVTVTHNTTDNQVKFYVDGDFIGSGGCTLNTGVDTPLRIGHSENIEGVADESFSGSLDEIQIYNYELSGREVLSRYNEIAEPDKIACIDPYAAVLDIAGPGTIVGDITSFTADPDCSVDLYDFAVFAQGWLTSGLFPEN